MSDNFTVIGLYIINPRVLYEFNPLNTELNPICHLLALLGAHHILHISRIRVNRTDLQQQSNLR
jgi:hypothetical protein